MSNLGHLWTYDHLCIKESPMHPNTCRTRVISMHCLCFKIYNSCFSQIPRFVGAASTPSWCPREILRPLLSELVIRLPLRSAFRFCLRHQEGVELQKFLTYSHSSLIPHGSLGVYLRQGEPGQQLFGNGAPLSGKTGSPCPAPANHFDSACQMPN